MPNIVVAANVPLVGPEADAFFQYVKARHNPAFYCEKGLEILVADYHFTLAQNIYFQKQSIGGSETFFAYFIEEEKPAGKPHVIGSGGMAVVYSIEKSHVFSPTHLEFKPSGYTQPQVLKVQKICKCPDDLQSTFCTKHIPEARVKNEHHYSEQAKHLNVQPLGLAQDKRVAYIVMYRMPGINLYELRHVILGISTQQRMDLCLDIVRKVKSQVTDLGLIHHDLKLENVLCDLSTMRVNIIDFGLSSRVEAGSKPKMITWVRGTSYYYPFEMVDAWIHKKEYPDTPKIDVFALGRMFLEIWGGSDTSFTGDTHHLASYRQHLIDPLKQELPALFNALPKHISSELRAFGLDQSLRALFKHMLANDVNARYSIEKVLISFEKIYIEYRQKISSSNPTLTLAAVAATVIPLPLAAKMEPMIDQPKRVESKTQCDVQATTPKARELNKVRFFKEPALVPRTALPQGPVAANTPMSSSATRLQLSGDPTESGFLRVTRGKCYAAAKKLSKSDRSKSVPQVDKRLDWKKDAIELFRLAEKFSFMK